MYFVAINCYSQCVAFHTIRFWVSFLLPGSCQRPYSSYYRTHSLRVEALFPALFICRVPWVARTSDEGVTLLQKELHCFSQYLWESRRFCIDVRRRFIIVLYDKPFVPVGAIIIYLSTFQSTPVEGIIGNHPCNAVPLSYVTAEWNHTAVVLSLRCKNHC